MSLYRKDSHFTYLIIYDTITFKVLFENNFHRLIMNVLYCAIGFCLSQQHETHRNKDSNDLMVNKFKLTVVHFACPNQCRSVHVRGFTAGQKKLWKMWTGPPGLRAAGVGLLLAKPVIEPILVQECNTLNIANLGAKPPRARP